MRLRRIGYRERLTTPVSCRWHFTIVSSGRRIRGSEKTAATGSELF